MMRLGRGERGSTAVEAAIVTPVVVAMLFGIIEFGMLFKDYLSVEAMVRAGVRSASAAPRTATFAQDTADQMQKTGTAISPNTVQQLWVYKANPTDDFPIGNTSFSGCSVCVKFRWDDATAKFIPISSTWTAAQQNACTAAVGGPPDRIGVYLQTLHNSMTGIIGPTTLSESSAMFLEPFPALSGCKP